MKSLAALLGLLTLTLASIAACSSSSGRPTTCDQACQDGAAVRALRDAVKLTYNLLLQGGPVGAQDRTAPCPPGGTVHVHGTATSVAEQGTTMVNLTYDFADCLYSETDSDPTKTFSLTLTGTVIETGNIASDPSSTTSLTLDSPSMTMMTIEGTVFAPSETYDARACNVTLSQNGDKVSGKICDRPVGISL